METQYVIGVDFGTDSCRAIVVNTENGTESAITVKEYPRWKNGLFCDPGRNQYRQHPLDYIESMTDAITEAINLCPQGTRNNIAAISITTTGSTPVLIDENGTPLAMLNSYQDNPNAMFILWKDHTAIQEAEEINALVNQWKINYTSYSGGIYSPEWVWAKMLHMLRVDSRIHQDVYSWVEHCDWIPALLTGNTKPEEIKRSRCAAGHKAMWNEEWNGLPSCEFLKALDPLMTIFKGRLFSQTYTSDQSVGSLTPYWARMLGLSTNVLVGVGALDCHMGAIGAGVKENTIVRVIGTSTCDIMVVSPDILDKKTIPGICGQVDGSVIPGMIGLEAGQSAFGDVYAWFRNFLEWPLQLLLNESTLIDDITKEKLYKEISNEMIPELTRMAESIPIEESTLIATDWLNGRRTPYANPLLTASITGLTLGTTAPMVFRALVEATAYGSKAIIKHFIDNGINIEEIVAIGGITQKSPFVMQTLADVLGLPIKIAKTKQACALGAAMFASVVAGKYDNIKDAQKSMGQGISKEYRPDMRKQDIYDECYNKYMAFV